jgi:hypothetical protein
VILAQWNIGNKFAPTISLGNAYDSLPRAIDHPNWSIGGIQACVWKCYSVDFSALDSLSSIIDYDRQATLSSDYFIALHLLLLTVAAARGLPAPGFPIWPRPAISIMPWKGSEANSIATGDVEEGCPVIVNRETFVWAAIGVRAVSRSHLFYRRVGCRSLRNRGAVARSKN